MPLPNRRSFLQLSASGLLAGMAGALPTLKASGTPSAQPKSSGETAGAVTRELARFLVSIQPDQVPAQVRKEATRTLVNWMGVAVGGSHHETTETALAVVAPFSGAARAGVIGRRERVDAMTASFVNGVSSHVLDFDDTHLKTIVHASSSIVPPTLALAEHLGDVSGAVFLHALVLGIETAFRTANAIYPDHYEVGWHITGTVGALGAAAATGRLLKLSEQQMVWALGVAASQSVGLRESFGSMNKSFNPGRAAQNGLLAALLAARNFTSSEGMLEAKRGWANTVSTKQDFGEITDGLGTHYETALNAYKPFACGIVIHPVIDGCIRLRDEHKLRPENIDRVELRVHPLVLELTGKRTPKRGLETKFSVFHAAAVSLISGQAGPRQFSDEAALDAATIALRDRVSAEIDDGVLESQAGVTIFLKNGSRCHTFVRHAIGSVENPMTDAALTAKAADLMDGVLPSSQANDLIEACWKIENLDRASVLIRLGTPA